MFGVGVFLGLRLFSSIHKQRFTGGAEARLAAAGTLLTDRKDGYDAQERLGHSSMDVGGGA
ncbi:MAG: hypothetical protein EpisKO_08080 [Epibacterium sp.]